MTDHLEAARTYHGDRSYQGIAKADGERLPDVITVHCNPVQPTTDIGFGRYTDRAFFDLEMQKMWRKVWQFACREEHVREVGDYYVYDIGKYSVIVTRTDDGIKAYHNSCLHRGTKLKPSGSNGWSASIQCPFHGWDWNLDGSINNIPCAWEFPHLPKDKAALPELQVGTWNGFIFINFDKDARPLVDYLEVLPAHFANWDLSQWYVHTHVQKKLPGNWKLGQEAFMEAYHTPVAHPEMTHVVSDINMQHDIFSDHVSRDLCAMASPSPTSPLNLTEQELLERMLVSDASMIAERPKVPEGKTARWVMAQQLKEQMQRDHGLDYSNRTVPEMIDSLKYNLFPNTFIYGSVALCLIQQFRPNGDDHNSCVFDQYILRPKPTDGSDYDVAECVTIEETDSYTTVPGMDPFLGAVLDQDTDIMRWQREGMYASEKGAETLAIYQESRIRHMHATLDKYLNA